MPMRISNLDYDSLKNRTLNTSTRTAISGTWCGSSSAVTVLDEMRGSALSLGLQTFALWRLGEEDGSLWNTWDKA